MSPPFRSNFEKRVQNGPEIHNGYLEQRIVAEEEDPRISRFTPAQQKKIIWHVDRRLVITLGLLYCTSLMDRINLGSAAIARLTIDLQMDQTNRYSLVSLIFFIPYVIFQPPATIILRKLGPRKFLTAIALFWGATMVGFGFVTNWEEMMVLRALLGMLEAGFFPGCAYLLSTWYPRYDLQKRNAIFYLIGCIATAFAGILSYGLMLISPAGGLDQWQWIFIVEGIITCVASITGYFFIVDFPELAAKSWRFLSPAESEFIVARIEKDRHHTILEPFTAGNYFGSALDLKIWGFAGLFMLATANSYALAYFLPIILEDGMKFNIPEAQTLVAPPFIAAAIVMYIEAIYADRWHLRGPIVIFNAALGLVGLPLLGFATNDIVRYFGAFLATISGNANIPAILTYQANNIRGQWKRAFCSATLVGFGGIGGIIGSTVFRDQDKPAYMPGIIATIAGDGLIMLIVLALSIKFYRANKRADMGGKIIERQADFRYTF